MVGSTARSIVSLTVKAGRTRALSAHGASSPARHCRTSTSRSLCRDLVGRFVSAEVEHDVQPHRDDPERTVTWIRLSNLKQADAFELEAPEEDEVEEERLGAPEIDEEDGDDLSALMGL